MNNVNKNQQIQIKDQKYIGQKLIEKQSTEKININKVFSDQNQSQTAQINVQSIFDNLKILLQDLRKKQIQIQQYVQKEIQEMNQNLNFAKSQLEKVIQLIQKQILEENITQAEVNIQKQIILNSSQIQVQQQKILNLNNQKLQPQQSDSSTISQSKSKIFMPGGKMLQKFSQTSNNFNSQNLQKSNSNEKKDYLTSSMLYKGSLKFKFVESQHDQINPQIQEKNINQVVNQKETNYFNNSQKNDNKNKNLFETEYFQVRSVCYNCQKYIESDSIQTPCLHFYHQACLIELYQIQLESYLDSKQIICICQRKLSQLFFKQILNVNLEQLFSKQIILIKNQLKNKINQCVKCQFFWIKGFYDQYITNCQICGQIGIIIKQ
ncbi:unnamed protein product [Paramecium sonneborni]|uniref:RING-type domain-containing protein n=1 Tax=Paramecium sonneborni TaxID=65129 RepID=A0A8S1PH53_9CILI|nr:unnamed protein product [Paramecium sonneborni]